MVEDITTNAGRVKFNKNQDKYKRIIHELVKDNIISVITLLSIAKECFDTLMNLYEKNSLSQKMDLKNNLFNLKMEDDSMEWLFTNISLVREQLFSIGVEVDEYGILQTTIDGLLFTCETLLTVVNGRKV